MFAVRRLRPSSWLSPYVRAFEARTQRLDAQLVLRPLPARPEHFLEFYLADRYRVRDAATGVVETAPAAVLVGPQTFRRVDVLLAGDLDLFTVQFTPTGFSALFGHPTSLLTDQAYAADAMLGLEVSALAERLAAAPGLIERARLAEAWLVPRIEARPVDPIAWAACRMERLAGAVKVADLAEATDLGERQFARRFTAAVGVTPKLYGRILRFREALRLRGEEVGGDWAAIAHAAGYADQAHMIHEFRALSGETPTGLSRALAAARETVLPDDGILQSTAAASP